MKAILTIFVLCAGTALAQIPQTIHHQGRIAVDGVNFDGTGQFKFMLYATKTSGGVLGPIWKNDDSTPTTMAEPSAAVGATVTKGLYSIALGESPQAPLTGDLLQPVVLLRIWFNDGVNGFQQLAPDRKIASVPFARHADITGQDISLLNNDAGYVVTEDFEFARESDSASFSEAELGGTSGSHSTSFTFSETFPDIPEITLGQSIGLTNSVISNVTTTGFDLDFDYAITVGLKPTPAAEPLPYFDLVHLGGEIGLLFADGPLVVSQQTAMGFTFNLIQTYPDLKFMRASDAGGSAWSAPVTLANVHIPFNPLIQTETFDAAFIGGAPSVVYVEAEPMTLNPSTGEVTFPARLLYRRASDALGSAWASPIEVDPAAFAASAVSVAGIGNLPAILYNIPSVPPSGFPPMPGSPAKLNFARATDIAGSSWQIFDTGADPADPRSKLAEIDGKPAFVTATASGSDPVLTLELHRASDATGTTWDPPVTVWAATTAEVGGSSGVFILPDIELIEVQGRPAVAVSAGSFSNFGLRYLRANDAAGATWPAPVTAATNAPGTVIGSLAAVEDAGFPVIAYRSGDDFLRTTGTNADGASWSSPENIGANVKGSVAMLPDAGGPVSAASGYDTIPTPLERVEGYPANGFLPVLPTMGSISLSGDLLPELEWTADDPADVQLQQQLLTLDGTDLSISAGNTIDLSPLTVPDHGALTGLLDDDHPQYFRGDGSEPFGGPLNLGGNAISGIGSLTVTGSVNLPTGSVSNSDLQSSVMIAGENVSLLTNDAGYIPSTGNATLTGDLTISGDYKFTTPKIFTLRIPPTSFLHRAGSVLRQEDGSATSNGRTVAAFELPPGATITSVSVLVDAPTAVNTTIDFRCTDLSPGASGTRSLLDNLSTNSTTGIEHVALGGTPITVGTDELYSLDVKVDQSTLYGARVNYTLDTLAP